MTPPWWIESCAPQRLQFLRHRNNYKRRQLVHIIYTARQRPTPDIFVCRRISCWLPAHYSTHWHGTLLHFSVSSFFIHPSPACVCLEYLDISITVCRRILGFIVKGDSMLGVGRERVGCKPRFEGERGVKKDQRCVESQDRSQKGQTSITNERRYMIDSVKGYNWRDKTVR